MKPSGYIGDWLSGPGWAAPGWTLPYSSIVRAQAGTSGVMMQCSETPTMSGGSGAADDENRQSTLLSWGGAPTFAASGSNGYAITVATSDSLAGTLPASITTGSWVVVFLPTAWPSSGNLAAIVGLDAFTSPSTHHDDRVLYVDSTGALTFMIRDTSWTAHTITSAAGALSKTFWHEIIAIWDGTNVTLYLDQAQVGTIAVTPQSYSAPTVTSSTMFLGARTAGSGTYVGVAGTVDMICYAGSPITTPEGTAGDAGAADYAILDSGFTSGTGTVWNVSASSGFNVDPLVATALDGKTWTVSASSAFNVDPAGAAVAGVNHSYSVSASSSFVWNQSGAAVDHPPTAYSVSGATAFTINALATVIHTTSYMVSASTGWSIGGVARGHVPIDIELSAETTIYVGGIGEEDSSSHRVSASNAFMLTDVATKSKFGSVFLSAATNVNLSQFTAITNPGPRFVSASTSVALSQLTAITNPGPRYVSANTNVVLEGVGKENRDAAIAVATGFVVSSSATRNRDIVVSATTSFAASSTPGTNNLKTAAAHNGFNFTYTAAIAIGATEASSGIKMLDVAFATVQLPWRRTALTLGDGGNIPHS